ncbi:hypothetical protein F2P81_011427 [Scophthalmus maximus]|uniref:Protein kinase domain-containing protein n=1 Tax=Scophthalmus maximus TaxID=52904 RepID=A0A6A4STW2_SCOMX|nr:hypothetical protein F2P81_011427 [Scophthalmus maximus]
MNQWGNRNGRVGELIDLLERLQLFRPRDVILGWMSSQKSRSSSLRPPPPPPHPHVCLPQFDPPPKSSEAQPTLSTCRLTEGGGPPQGLRKCVPVTPFQGDRQDCVLDWNLLKETFQTEVEKLSKHAPLIHGDVKSSNVLLDCHLVAKLADFGLARFASLGSSGCSVARTASVGKTETIRGTLAYLPDEYVRNGELGTAVDVYSFGVVLLEVLTGRRALERDTASGERYLKDLVEEVEESPTGSCAAAWRKHLDHRLITGGAVEPADWMEVVSLANSCLDRKRKKRPAISEVLKKLKDVHNMVTKTCSSSLLHHPPPPHWNHPSQSFPCLPMSIDSKVSALSNQLSKLGPLEDTDQPSQYSTSSSSSCAPAIPHPLHSSSVFGGPCETDESRGFSQFRQDLLDDDNLLDHNLLYDDVDQSDDDIDLSDDKLQAATYRWRCVTDLC